MKKILIFLIAIIFSISSFCQVNILPFYGQSSISSTSSTCLSFTRPSDWPLILPVSDNQINLLVGDFTYCTPCFIVTTTGAVNYTVSWGDSVGVTHTYASGISASHTYSFGTGTACSLGYTTWKVNISSANAITRFYVARHALETQYQYEPILDAALGTTGLTSCNLMFTNHSTCFCKQLVNVTLPSTLNSCTTMNQAFQDCTALQSISLPTSMTLCNNLSNMCSMNGALKSITLPLHLDAVTLMDQAFYQCTGLSYVIMPVTMNALQTASAAFSYCIALSYIVLPTSLNSVTSFNQIFSYDANLAVIKMPTSMNGITNMSYFCNGDNCLSYINLPNMTGVTNIGYAFYQCPNLKNLGNFNNLGSISTAVDGSTGFQQLENVLSFSSAAKWSAINLAGTAGVQSKMTSIRLTNQASPFSGSSPQIDISYTSLVNDSLQSLYNWLPPNLSGKVIKITGVTGAPALITKASSGTVALSTTITMANTSTLATGMEVTGTGVSTAQAVTFTDAGDVVGLTAHGFPNGKMVSFPTITSTTGIVTYTPYYVVNTATNTFQVSLTPGGAVLPLTTNGTGTVLCIPVINTINANVSIVTDVPCSATGTVTVSASVLKNSLATLKGWVPTY